MFWAPQRADWKVFVVVLFSSQIGDRIIFANIEQHNSLLKLFDKVQKNLG